MTGERVFDSNNYLFYLRFSRLVRMKNVYEKTNRHCSTRKKLRSVIDCFIANLILIGFLYTYIYTLKFSHRLVCELIRRERTAFIKPIKYCSEEKLQNETYISVGTYAHSDVLKVRRAKRGGRHKN